jgi:SAM-dependent methyltransferase
MLAQRTIAQERMDDPALDAACYHAVLRDLARVNTVTLARRPTLDFLTRALAGRQSFRLLDVGFGNGDMLRAIAAWAQARGLVAELTGIDLNPRSEDAARAATPADIPIRWLTGDYQSLSGQGWDIIVSSLVAHHMTHAQLVAFLRFMDTQARIGWFVNDLHRHTVAWLGYPLLASAMRWHPIVRHDGRLSIARSYRPAEWAPILHEAGVEGARVARVFPFRLCVGRIV